MKASVACLLAEHTNYTEAIIQDQAKRAHTNTRTYTSSSPVTLFLSAKGRPVQLHTEQLASMQQQ